MAAKGINKRIIGLMIGTTVAGVAKMASTEKGKQQLKTRKDKAIDAAQSAIDFVHGGIQEMKKQTKKKDDTEERNK
ncbi:MAG: hypothetical protein WC004_04730 [Candidatus Absconditabacterales bacterium]